MPPLAPPPSPDMMPKPPMPGPMSSSPASMLPQPPMAGGGMTPPSGGGTATPAQGGVTPLPPEQVYGINLIVAEVLWRRIGVLGQDEVNRLADAITPDNAHVFMRLFPELSQAIQSALKDDTGGEEESMGEEMEGGEPQPGDYAGPPGTSPPARPGGGLGQF